uniref:(California timema) hypothetical protein n=1 Tax=Timema californicum TaxID=61474 RepID=A0A7R9P9W5_TIMCA|nr:unnamed protein product [Timema californicum]
MCGSIAIGEGTDEMLLLGVNTHHQGRLVSGHKLVYEWQLYGFSILSFLSLLATEPSDSPQSALGPFHGYTTVLGVRGTLKPPDLVTDEVKQILEGENIPSSCPLEPDELNSACVECQEILEPLQSTLTFLDASGSTFEDNSRPTQEQPLQNILEKLMIGLQNKENNSTSIQGLSFANSQLTSIPYKALYIVRRSLQYLSLSRNNIDTLNLSQGQMQQQRLQRQTHRETPHILSALAATSHRKVQ